MKKKADEIVKNYSDKFKSRIFEEVLKMQARVVANKCVKEMKTKRE